MRNSQPAEESRHQKVSNRSPMGWIAVIFFNLLLAVVTLLFLILWVGTGDVPKLMLLSLLVVMLLVDRSKFNALSRQLPMRVQRLVAIVCLGVILLPLLPLSLAITVTTTRPIAVSVLDTTMPYDEQLPSSPPVLLYALPQTHHEREDTQPTIAARAGPVDAPPPKQSFIPLNASPRAPPIAAACWSVATGDQK